MLANGVFSHTGANGITIEQRVVDAQYSPSGTFKVAENLAVAGTSGTPDVPALVEKTTTIFLKVRRVTGKR